jgi:hypothetical protein
VVAYILFCILCVLLAFGGYPGGWLWVAGTALAVFMGVGAEMVRLIGKGLDALEDRLARDSSDDSDRPK